MYIICVRSADEVKRRIRDLLLWDPVTHGFWRITSSDFIFSSTWIWGSMSLDCLVFCSKSYQIRQLLTCSRKSTAVNSSRTPLLYWSLSEWWSPCVFAGLPDCLLVYSSLLNRVISAAACDLAYKSETRFRNNLRDLLGARDIFIEKATFHMKHSLTTAKNMASSNLRSRESNIQEQRLDLRPFLSCCLYDW